MYQFNGNRQSARLQQQGNISDPLNREILSRYDSRARRNCGLHHRGDQLLIVQENRDLVSLARRLLFDDDIAGQLTEYSCASVVEFDVHDWYACGRILSRVRPGEVVTRQPDVLIGLTLNLGKEYFGIGADLSLGRFDSGNLACLRIGRIRKGIGCRCRNLDNCKRR